MHSPCARKCEIVVSMHDKVSAVLTTEKHLRFSVAQ